MTKKKMSELLDSVIDERRGYSYEFTEDGFVHLFSSDDSFTATFISGAINLANVYFMGVRVTFDGRPYLLFFY